MLSASKLPLFFWAEAIATACYTQNRSIIIPTHDKMAYHIINERKPPIKHLYIFGWIFYVTRDGENLDKMKEKGDPCILASDYENSNPIPQLQNVSSLADAHVPSQQELDLLFGPLYDEFFTVGTSSVNKSSSPTNNSNQQDTQPTMNIQPTSAPCTPTYVHTEENNDNQAKEEHLQDDEFTNPFYHPLEQVRGNPSKPVQTRRQLVIDPKMCMFALTVSTAEPKNIKEAMADSAWIEAMQEELHQFDRLQEEVYVAQPDGFIDPDHLEKVYRQCSLWIETSSKGLWHPKGSSFGLTAFSDADHEGCIDTRKITSGGIQFLGDKLVSWMSKKQDCTAMSSAEAEYVTLSASCA
nr:Gag-Pol polyprotein [Tanacetum cinerariifolium]